MLSIPILNFPQTACAKKSWVPWNEEEKDLFTQLYKTYKRNFDCYLPHFPGRTWQQLKSFYYNTMTRNRVISNRKATEKKEEEEETSPSESYADLLAAIRTTVL